MEGGEREGRGGEGRGGGEGGEWRKERGRERRGGEGRGGGEGGEWREERGREEGEGRGGEGGRREGGRKGRVGERGERGRGERGERGRGGEGRGERRERGGKEEELVPSEVYIRIDWFARSHFLNSLHCEDGTTVTCDGLLEGIPLPMVHTTVCPTCVGMSIGSPKHNTQHCTLLFLLAKYSSFGSEASTCKGTGKGWASAEHMPFPYISECSHMTAGCHSCVGYVLA